MCWPIQQDSRQKSQNDRLVTPVDAFVLTDAERESVQSEKRSARYDGRIDRMHVEKAHAAAAAALKG